MKSAGKARNNGLYRHIRTSKEIIRNLLNDSLNIIKHPICPTVYHTVGQMGCSSIPDCAQDSGCFFISLLIISDAVPKDFRFSVNPDLLR